MTRSSPRRACCRLLALASFAATLSACATSPAARPAAEPDPVIEQRTIVKTVCPPELLADLPAAVAFSIGAVIDATPEAVAGLRAHFEREQLLEQRLVDARSQCPHG